MRRKPGVRVSKAGVWFVGMAAVGGVLGGGCEGRLPTGGTGGTIGMGATAGATGAAGTLGDAGTSGEAGTSGGAGFSGSAGSGGSGGTTGGSGVTDGGGAVGQPPCPPTVTRGSACAAADIQLCYKPCGPENRGTKAETCTAGVYVEMNGCSFDPAMDDSCYKLPTVVPNDACPAMTTPQANAPCTAVPCAACNSNGGLPGTYLDSAGAERPGYCVCAAATQKWSCATTTAWPCPAGAGC